MTRKQFFRWAKKKGRIKTIEGYKYIRITKFDDEDQGMVFKMLCGLTGGAEWSVSFTLHDEKPEKWYKKKQEGELHQTTFHADGSQTIIIDGEITLVPAGQEPPSHCTTGFSCPLVSMWSLRSNLAVLKDFINDCLKNKDEDDD